MNNCYKYFAKLIPEFHLKCFHYKHYHHFMISSTRNKWFEYMKKVFDFNVIYHILAEAFLKRMCNVFMFHIQRRISMIMKRSTKLCIIARHVLHHNHSAFLKETSPNSLWMCYWNDAMQLYLKIFDPNSYLIWNKIIQVSFIS